MGAILEEMRRIQQQPVSQEELDRAKEALVNSFVFRFTSRFGIVVQLMTLEFNGYPADYLDTLLDRYRAVTVADVQRVAGQYLHPDASHHPRHRGPDEVRVGHGGLRAGAPPAGGIPGMRSPSLRSSQDGSLQFSPRELFHHSER